MEDWAEIRRLHRAEGMAIKAIVRRIGMSRNTVRRALASDEPPRYSRPAKGSVVDAVEPAIRELLRDCPTMPATVIAERIGWQHGLTILKDRVRELRPYYLPPDPSSRTEYDPGERVQCDLWFPPVLVPLGAGQEDSPPVLVMTSGYSRMRWARMIPSRTAPDLIAGHWQLLTAMGAVPAAAGVGQRGRGRFLAAREADPDRGVRGLPRQPRDRGAPVPAPRSRGQGADRAQQPLPGDLVPARAHVHRPR